MKSLIAITIFGSLAFAGCESKKSDEESAVNVTSVAHSKTVKQQTINNCWIYAMASWFESLHLSTGNGEVDVSESYWAYWHWYDELAWSPDGNTHARKKLEEGGGFHLGAKIVKKYGWVTEGEFIPAETDAVASQRQACALEYVKDQLEVGGALHYSSFEDRKIVRSHETVIEVLNKAFTCGDEANGIDGELVRNTYGKSADETLLKMPGQSSAISLTAMYDEWEVHQPAGSLDSASSKMLPIEKDQKYYDAAALAIRRALNDHMPVVIGFNLDFNAVNESNGMFDLNTYAKVGDNTKAAHMIVLSDYTVKNAAGFGVLGEGELTPEQKEAALSADLQYLVAKNSWGTAQSRDNRPWIGDGYSRLTWDYLTKGFVDESQPFTPMITAIVLPKSYKIDLR